MADSTPNIDTISASQSSKEVTANALFDANSPATLFGRRATTTAALSWGYYGGKYRKADGTVITVANSTVALTASATNYLLETDGVVSKVTAAPSGWPGPLASGARALYAIVCDGSGPTSYTDYRTTGIGAGPASGTVTSVGMTVPSGFSVSGSPVTGAGTLGVTISSPSAARTALGVAIGTDVQAYDPDLSAIAGLTATTDNFMQAKAGAWASRTVAQVTTDLQGDGLTSAQVGFRNIPQNSQSAAYTAVAADSGKHILHPAADTTARTFTIDSNANVAYPVGTAITFVNEHGAGVLTIAITSDTLRLAGAGTTGSRTLAADGVATALKITATSWIISGTGLT